MGNTAEYRDITKIQALMGKSSKATFDSRTAYVYIRRTLTTQCFVKIGALRTCNGHYVGILWEVMGIHSYTFNNLSKPFSVCLLPCCVARFLLDGYPRQAIVMGRNVL
jgi:hypothetical protein